MDKSNELKAKLKEVESLSVNRQVLIMKNFCLYKDKCKKPTQEEWQAFYGKAGLPYKQGSNMG